MNKQSSQTFKIVKNIGCIALLFTVSCVEEAQASKVKEYIDQIQQRFNEQYRYDEMDLMTEEQIRQQVSEELRTFLDYPKTIFGEVPEGRNFIEIEQQHHHHHENKHHHHHHEEAPKIAVSAPAQKTLMANQVNAAGQQLVTVPIEDPQGLTLTVGPTHGGDIVDSVTLKAFRKVVGYDTFNSILKGDRDETKDPNDHYNVTVSLMVTRKRAVPKAKPQHIILDKGFPYDDSDITVTARAPAWGDEKTDNRVQIGVLNGQNITKGAIRNLVQDRTSPITENNLLQIDSDINKSDSDGLFALLGNNVTRGALKNLVTDKPSPITVKLAQKSDSDGLFSLLGNNVTRGALKNLVTDKPSPITIRLAQKSDSDGLFALLGNNVTRGALKNLVTDKPSPITLKLAQIENKFKSQRKSKSSKKSSSKSASKKRSSSSGSARKTRKSSSKKASKSSSKKAKKTGSKATKKTKKTGSKVSKKTKKTGSKATKKTRKSGSKSSKKTRKSGSKSSKKTRKSGSKATKKSRKSGSKATKKTKKSGSKSSKKSKKSSKSSKKSKKSSKKSKGKKSGSKKKSAKKSKKTAKKSKKNQKKYSARAFAPSQKKPNQAIIDGDLVTGMTGTEEIHGKAMVGGAHIRFHQHRSVSRK